MKLTLIASILAISTTLFCGFSNKALAQTHTKKVSAKPGPAKKINEIAQGKSLLEKSDCLSCHRPNVKLIGPSYKDVAAKYASNEANYALLTQKIINGGSGTWGEVSMSPHPSLAGSDVKKMVKYILTIK